MLEENRHEQTGKNYNADPNRLQFFVQLFQKNSPTPQSPTFKPFSLWLVQRAHAMVM